MAHQVTPVQLRNGRAFVFSVLMQMRDATSINSRPVLIIIQDAANYEEALGKAMVITKEECPGFTLIDTASFEVTA